MEVFKKSYLKKFIVEFENHAILERIKDTLKNPEYILEYAISTFEVGGLAREISIRDVGEISKRISVETRILTLKFNNLKHFKAFTACIEYEVYNKLLLFSLLVIR